MANPPAALFLILGTASASWVQPAGSDGILPLADFGTVHISNSLVNGSAIGNASPQEIIMINNSGQDKDTVSSLSSGENFSATWVRAS